MSTFKFADVTLLGSIRTWINFHEVECIQECCCRFDVDGDTYIESDKYIKDDENPAFEVTKITMKSGRIYYVDSLLDDFVRTFYIMENMALYNYRGGSTAPSLD